MKAILLIFLTFPILAECVPSFELTRAWRGGDAAYSIDMGEKTLWLFGDSFISKNGQRKDADFIGNSIGISTCVDNQWDISYHWKVGQQGETLPFFKDAENGDRFWPKDGVFYKGKLYIFLTKVRSTQEGGALGFEVYDTTLAVVDNPLQAPRDWNYQYIDFIKGNEILGAAAVVIESGYLYSFSTVEHSEKGFQPLMLQRIKLSNLEKFEMKIESLGVVKNQGAHEISVHFDDKQKLWKMTVPAQGFAKYALSFESDSLFGPWKNQQEILTYEAMDEGLKDVFCYAPKYHKKFAAYTYVCNSLDGDTVLKNENIYLPMVVK